MARFKMMEDPGNNREEGQQVKSSFNWPAVVGAVVLVIVLLAVTVVFAWKLGWLSNLAPFSKWSTPEVIELNPSVNSDGTISREYEWSYDGNSIEMTLPIPKDIYDYYSKMERAPIEDYSIYVTHPDDDAELVYPLAAELKRLAVQKAYDSEETVNFAASFVQNLKYRLEDEEYPNYPVETLFDKGGDCEDTAILTAALLQAMGYDTVLIRFSPVTGAGHMAVGVAVAGVSGGYSYPYDGKNYYYLETTSTSWGVGDLADPKYKQADGIYALERVPALRFSGKLEYSVESRWFSDKTVGIGVTVTNWGTANADDFYVSAFFEGHASGARSSATYDLAYGHRISGVVAEGIVVPSGGGTLLVELWLDGDVVDDWTVDIS
jgi:hypothetical protein